MEINEGVSQETVLPNHDFLGLVGIQHEDILTLYGVIPRFWYDSFSDNRIVLDSKTHARILTQKNETQMDKEEAKRVQQKINHIKGIYQRDEEVIEQDEEGKDERIYLGDTSSEEASEVLEKLFYLCEFYHKKKKKQDITEKQEIERDGLPIFQFEEFVDLLEQRTRELRRTYRTVVEDVGAVRGRITTRGMMMMVARPSPMIECEYETFDIQAPLYKVMMSTLDVIRSTRLPRGFTFLEKKFERICRRGANLRMKMAGIPSFPLTTAIRECVKLNRRLPRMFTPFRELLPIALQILKRESHRLNEDEEDLSSWHITAPSSKLWELLLEESLRMSGNRWEIHPQERIKGPWHARTPKNIDLCITDHDDKVTLVDAKYSVAKPTPSSEYQYQQFFYAVGYAAKNIDLPNKVALLHPRHFRNQQGSFGVENLTDEIQTYFGGNNVEFYVWTLPFPQPDNITDSDLEAYIQMINPILEGFLGA
jgi:5-methylcytosine-specific restriction endonuclease McrBC regulatory subunit McrC